MSGIWKDNKLVKSINPNKIEFPLEVSHLLINPKELPIRIIFVLDNLEINKKWLLLYKLYVGIYFYEHLRVLKILSDKQSLLLFSYEI